MYKAWSTKALTEREFKQAVSKFSGRFEEIDTHNFSIGLSAIHGRNVQTFERNLRACKASERLALKANAKAS
jgi:hypothetical protein